MLDVCTGKQSKVTKRIDKFRTVILYKNPNIIRTDFDFYTYIKTNHKMVNLKRSGFCSNMDQFKALCLANDWEISEEFNTLCHQTQWHCSVRLLVFAKMNVGKKRYSVFQFNDEILIVDGHEAYDFILMEGTRSPVEFIKGMK
ncbi:MAG: hypothetical protein GY909_15270 [Oligoflexia bacterium]|nr:hypothetical protein [Oligoflexia bacterium]